MYKLFQFEPIVISHVLLINLYSNNNASPISLLSYRYGARYGTRYRTVRYSTRYLVTTKYRTIELFIKDIVIVISTNIVIDYIALPLVKIQDDQMCFQIF